MKCPHCQFQNSDDSHFCSHCGTPIPASADPSSTEEETKTAPLSELTIGDMFFKKFQVLEELGRGGMGRVYKVLDKEVHEEIALKLIKPAIATEAKTVERFRNELRLSRQISHRNVCRMYELHEEEGAYYITMEYVPGEDLKSSLKRIGPLTPGKAISIMKQICEGLAEAHRLGVIHRDLKPRNIMIDKEGNVRIMDFGIARSLKTEGLTDTGVIIGTPEYMSPEQVEGRETDHRSDIYSLGVVLFEMLTGGLPFQGKTPLSVALKHKTDPAPDPREINARIPEELSRMILKCMEKEKERRYQSIQELHSELSLLEEKFPTTGQVIPDTLPLSSEELIRSSLLRKIFTVSAIFIVAIAAGIILWNLIPPEPLPEHDRPSLAVMYFENNTGDENLDHWKKALCELLIADLSQSKHIRVLSGDQIFQILRRLNLEEAHGYSSDDLKRAASQGGVDHILRGSLAKAGNTYRIHAMLHNASTGKVIGAESVEGRGEESLFSMVDEMTKRVKTILKFSKSTIANDIDREVGNITTKSPEAYRYYIDGRKYFLKGDNNLSVQFLKRALAIDPEFAMAYRGIAIANRNLGKRTEEKEYLQKALELKDRISERERYLIEGDYCKLSERTFDQAVSAYSKVLEIYPDDLSANVNLGNLYRDYEMWDKAIERFEVMISFNEKAFYPYNNLAKAYEAIGKYDRAMEVLEDYLYHNPDNAIVHGYLSLNYLSQGKYDLALKEIDRASSLDPTYYHQFWIKGDIHLCRGDLVQAEEEYKRLLSEEKQPARLWGRSRLAGLNLMQGHFKESERQIYRAMELAQELGGKEKRSVYELCLAYVFLKSGRLRNALEASQSAWQCAMETENSFMQREALYHQALIELEMNALDEAQETMDQLKKLIDQAINKKEIRIYHHLSGIMLCKKKDFSSAIASFKKAISLLPSQSTSNDKHAPFIESLAFSLYQSGHLEQAQKEYERILSLTTGRLEYGDIFAKSHYMLGIIFQERGFKGKAIEHYEEFLELWRNADSDPPAIENARRQLMSLKEI